MSLKPAMPSDIPELTQQVARAAFPKGCVAMRLRDEFGTLYQDADFADLFPKRGQPALPAWRLALVTVLQFGNMRWDWNCTMLASISVCCQNFALGW
jgi:transposase